MFPDAINCVSGYYTHNQNVFKGKEDFIDKLQPILPSSSVEEVTESKISSEKSHPKQHLKKNDEMSALEWLSFVSIVLGSIILILGVINFGKSCLRKDKIKNQIIKKKVVKNK